MGLSPLTLKYEARVHIIEKVHIQRTKMHKIGIKQLSSVDDARPTSLYQVTHSETQIFE